MKKIHLAIGIHNHQPVGNFDAVFEEAFQKAYWPFLQLHERFPNLKLAQHYSGILLQWINEHHPEFMPRLRAMADRGQVEVMTGGFYEPILASIPAADGIGQIKQLTRYIEENVQHTPGGCWIAERVWEPDLPSTLAGAGVSYSVMDDAHFKLAGVAEEALYGYYMTEHLGKAIRIFPISEKLRYAIPFQPPEEIIAFLRSVATEAGDRLVVFADDGEKFGAWPETYELCYDVGWLDSFFRLLDENRDWIHLLTFQEILQKLPPKGRIYLPTASYREMMEWSLPAQSFHQYENFSKWLKMQNLPGFCLDYVNAGFWRNFQAKYPESNNMHKRMLRSSMRASRLMHRGELPAAALDHLYAGQCNCPYWHGVFGGLYLPHLRYPIYHHLIQADLAMDQVEKNEATRKSGWIEVSSLDMDCDGHDEIIVETSRQNLFIAPHSGGTLFEWDLKGPAVNILDTMSRWEEGYHRRLLQTDQQGQKNSSIISQNGITFSKEENLDQYLCYDWYRRSGLLDHFLHPGTTLETFSHATYGEQGDFVNQPYTLETTKSVKSIKLTLQRDGHVWIDNDFVPVSVSKCLTVHRKRDQLEVEYRIKNKHNLPAALWFGTESAFSLMAGHSDDRYFYCPGRTLAIRNLASKGALEEVSEFGIRDEWLGIDVLLTFEQPGSVWRFPIETVSMSEAGIERIYQCSVVMYNRKLLLEPDEIWGLRMIFDFRMV